MIFQFRDTAFDNSGIRRVDDHELIRMHGNAHAVFIRKGANRGKLTFEFLHPIDFANRMRRERHRVRGDPKEHKSMLKVPFQNALKAGKVPGDGLFEFRGRVGRQTEFDIGLALKRGVDADVADFHGTNSRGGATPPLLNNLTAIFRKQVGR